MSTVTCTTVEKVDPQAGNNKLYRTYAMDNWLVFQHGPRTIATGGGRWIGQRVSSPALALRKADDKIDEELSEGYSNRVTVTFEYNGSLSTDKADLQPLDHARAAAANGSMSGLTVTPSGPPVPAFTPPPAPAPAPDPALNPHAAFTARALAAVNLAVTDPSKALVELAVLREEFAELEKIHRKAASYLSTLDRMLLTGADA